MACTWRDEEADAMKIRVAVFLAIGAAAVSRLPR